MDKLEAISHMDSNKFKIKEEKYFTHTEVVAAAAQMNCYTNVGIKKRKSLMESGAGCPDDENDYDENDDDYDDDFDDLNSSYNSISKLNEANMSKKLKNNSKQPKHDSEQLSKRLVADKNDDSNSESRQQKKRVDLHCVRLASQRLQLRRGHVRVLQGLFQTQCLPFYSFVSMFKQRFVCYKH